MGKLYNPTNKPTSFLYDGKEFVVGAKEAREFPEVVFTHYLRHVNGPMVAAELSAPEEEAPEPSEPKPYEEMKWQELLREARKQEWYRVGMKRNEILEYFANQ